MTTRMNIWLDDNELVMFYRAVTFHVIEKYAYYVEVFSGKYEDCLKYLDMRREKHRKEKYA